MNEDFLKIGDRLRLDEGDWAASDGPLQLTVSHIDGVDAAGWVWLAGLDHLGRHLKNVMVRVDAVARAKSGESSPADQTANSRLAIGTDPDERGR
ncbi:hypothetical protein AB0H43_20415 [Hamadaea sp. NPDC050747]|uniref:hypothetical protein n=1 Tax=Hamadaea sp. NPDC050747 TaxID=3155789 RepID=UPI0033E28AB9